MNLILTVLEIVAPVFILASIGFAWVKLGFDYRIEFVTRLAMTLSVPCLIFVALMRTNIAPDALTTVSLAAIAAYGLVTIGCFLLVKLAGMDVRTYLAPLIFGNTGNLGLPLALFAFGDEGLGYAVVIFAIMAIYSFTFGIWLVSGGGSITKVVKEPLVGATVLGAVFLVMDWETPRFLTNAIELIGQMAIPLMLITLGVAVARLQPRGVTKAVIASLAKAAICIAAAVAAGIWFALPAVPFAVLILQISTPVAVTSYLLSVKYEADSDAVAGLVVVSTLLAVVYIPLTLAFLV
ncbi:AEC family transporter [Litoreibacter arenae]|uniref:Auxin efflux carrier family protein n=1 Tax=Litoreibacter arenae DSM 19593 TaxID=1123360 RepID=S9RI87_9RHOB|nr:AEC family transporter [Litoreibacter arenae]EPX77820.1 Auxin efflux carrier family protein [Litoreibacter arenae DSM 19593]